MHRFLLLALLLLPLFLSAQEKPLTALPYTPALATEFMDKSVDPCVDFYKYSCGNWNKVNPIPADQAAWDVYGKLADENMRFLWGVLEQAAQAGERSANEHARNANEQKIGDYFHACMNIAAIDALDAKPLAAGLARIAALHSPHDLAAYIAEEHKQSQSNVLFGFGSGQDYDDSSRMIAQAGAGGLGLPDRDYYTKTDAKSREIRQRYVQHIQRMLEMTGEAPAGARTDAQAVMKIETDLAIPALTRVEKRNPYNLKHKLSLTDLQRLTPAFDWNIYLTGLGAPVVGDVNVSEPKFYQRLNVELNAQSMAAWKAYLRWHLVHSRATVLAARFNQADFDFYSAYLRGVKEMAPRWKKCTRLVDRQLGDALGQVFVAKTFAPQTKQDALQVTQQIEAEMGKDIRSLSWMSDETKQQALKKLNGIVNKIGYPDKWRDYSSVQIQADDFAGNAGRLWAFDTRRDLLKIGKAVDRTEWFITPPTVNAYYDPQMNDINFPGGVLQPPLFDPKMDAAPNYGNTGATIGHELTHGFDDEGRQFDATGNLKDWWTTADAKAFEDRVSCVRKQYAGYVVIDNIHINSSLTVGEDVADLGGTFLAYAAWKHATEGKNPQPADNLTPDQRFFVGMAQWACGDERPESKRVHAAIDPHSPLEFRVNGVVSNMPEFGAAFACKAGQPMMRVNACRVW
jgi:endothelin-converting enzyme/putative endopeptidase